MASMEDLRAPGMGDPWTFESMLVRVWEAGSGDVVLAFTPLGDPMTLFWSTLLRELDSAVFDGEAGGEEAASERRRMCNFWRAPDRDGIVFGLEEMWV